MNTGACFESVVNAIHPYPWISGTEFGYLISIMVPLNHHPATPGVCNSERSNRNKSSTAKWNGLSTQHFNTAFQHSIKMVFRESHCDSVCVEVMETQKTQFSHL